MKTINSAITLASLVNEHPDLAGELERRGLDYCCGGQRTLLEACVAHGLDPASTTAELSQAALRTARAAEWASMDAVALVEHLVATHHAYLWAELPRLSALLAKIVSVHGERHAELAAVAVPRTWGTPRPRSRKILPVWVPRGITRSSAPSSVSNTNTAPSAAWVMGTCS